MIDPYQALSGRKKQYGYASLVDAELPTARNAYYNNRSYEQSQEALRQQEEALAATKQNYADQLALSEEQNKYAQQQGNVSNLLGLGSLGVSAYPMLKDSGIVDSVTSAAGNLASGAKNVALAGTDYLGLTSTPSASGGARASLSQATPVNTQTTGEIASTGIIPKTTVDLNQGYSIGDAATQTPSYVYEGGPSDIMTAEGVADSGGFLSNLASNPYTMPVLGGIGAVYGGKILEGAKDLITDPAHTIGDFASGASENLQGFVRNPVGSIVEAVGDIGQDIGDAFNDYVDTAVSVVRDPLGAVADVADSHFCTAVAVNTHVDHETKMRLDAFRKYCKEHYPEEAAHYFENGGKIISAIESTVPDKKAFFNELKFDLVLPVSKLVHDGKYEEAVTLYRNKYIALMDEFMVELKQSYEVARG